MCYVYEQDAQEPGEEYIKLKDLHSKILIFSNNIPGESPNETPRTLLIYLYPFAEPRMLLRMMSQRALLRRQMSPDKRRNAQRTKKRSRRSWDLFQKHVTLNPKTNE